MIETDWKDPQAARLVKRLRRHQNDLFTFVDQPGNQKRGGVEGGKGLIDLKMVQVRIITRKPATKQRQFINE